MASSRRQGSAHEWWKRPLTLVLTLLAAVIAGTISKELVQQLLEPSAAETERAVEEGFRRAQAELSTSLPRRIDEFTTLDSITAAGMSLQYNYILDLGKSEFSDLAQFYAGQRQALVQQVCSNRDMTESLGYGAYYTYSYVDRSGNPIADFVIENSDCL